MADGITPGLPEEQAAPSTAVAESYIKEELAAARGTLRNTQIFGSIIIIALCVYMISITARFTKELSPDVAVETVKGFAVGQIQETGDVILSEIQTRVPAMLEEAPDKVIEQLPEWRQGLEGTFREQMQTYASSSKDKLNASLGEYLTDNKEKIKAVLDASKDPEAISQLKPTIHDEVMAYLDEPQGDNGKSIKDEVDESLAMLSDASKTIHRLATAKDLSPAEKKTRRALAVIAATIDDAQLEKLDLSMLQQGLDAADDEPAADDKAAE